MAKAQAELDSVVGRARYPTFDDESSLPYVQAFIKESMRCVFSPFLLGTNKLPRHYQHFWRYWHGVEVWAMKSILIAFVNFDTVQVG